MSVFRYKILKDNRLILTNWINADSRADALRQLQPEHVECEIRLTVVFGPSQWKC